MKRSQIAAGVMSLAWGALFGFDAGRADEIRDDERVVFFPTAAWLSDDGRHWSVPIHGWIFEPEDDSFLRAAAISRFRDFLGLSSEAASAALFDQRARWFLVDNERGKQLAVRIADQTFTLEPSDADGHFSGTVQLGADAARRLAAQGRIRFQAVTRSGDRRKFEGEVHLIAPQGTSVISDIDDTIKVSEVTDKRKLLENTFCRPFRAVEGMAEVYRTWARDGATLHFVSASPWQLYPPLAEFVGEAGFPPATYHLRRIRVKDSSVLQLLADPKEAKLAVIGAIMARFPQRRFVLVGDSGERDPEVYGEVARRFPGQVSRIYLRDVTGEPAETPRYGQAFQNVPADLWRVFREAGTLLGR
jgi:hypothetical protein